MISLEQFTRKNNKGFTLIELVVTTAIIVSFTLIMKNSLSNYLSFNYLNIAEQQLVSHLRNAQLFAMLGKNNASYWGVNYTGTSAVLFSGSSYAGRDATRDEKIYLPPGITITGLTSVVFTSSGGYPSTTQTITVSTPTGASKTITINTLGAIFGS